MTPRVLSLYIFILSVFLPFFFNDTATTEIYTLSLHDALPIFPGENWHETFRSPLLEPGVKVKEGDYILAVEDRKSTRLNSSHVEISYAVFCLKKKNRGHTYTSPAVTPVRPRPPARACHIQMSH